MISFREALQAITSSAKAWGSETVLLERALGRVLAENIIADRDYPPFHRATMDGYAIKANDVVEKKIRKFHIVGEIFAGDDKHIELHSGEAIKIMTGAPVPLSADAVIKKEDAREENGSVVFDAEQIKPGLAIARQGEDLARGAQAIPERTRITAGVSSLLAALGSRMVNVQRLPSVAILSIGNEVQSVDAEVAPHQIRDSNSYAVASMLEAYGIRPAVRTIIQDDLSALADAIRSVQVCDILITSGGVSAGDADFVPAAMKQCGVQEVFHKIKIKPGKPLWFGRHANGLTVFALPGNPYSVQVACKLFVESYLRACFGLPAMQPLVLPMNNARTKKTPYDEFFPAKILTDQATRIEPLVYHTSGDITAALFADGIAHHPAGLDDLAKGSGVEFYGWS
ncbi:MAG TPA: molybdopterin molybdotransferase MoeA [Bacteroidota bacterium]|nr:molybdopterin molybdotransferase MoeA [Bacteroidota bacterium]